MSRVLYATMQQACGSPTLGLRGSSGSKPLKKAEDLGAGVWHDDRLSDAGLLIQSRHSVEARLSDPQTSREFFRGNGKKPRSVIGGQKATGCCRSPTGGWAANCPCES